MNVRSLRSLTFPWLLLVGLLTGCAHVSDAFKAYEGEPLAPKELATVVGDGYVRRDFLNRFVDRVRFFAVNGRPIENSERFNAIQLTPGVHDITVYFSWDTGSLRGLAPAMVDYAASRPTISRTLNLPAFPGRTYHVRAEPVFGNQRQDITTLEYVDFWVVDDRGRTVVSREAGRYVAAP